MAKLLLLRFITGAVAKEVVWLKTGALLPGHQPSTKDGEPLKLKREREIKFTETGDINYEKTCITNLMFSSRPSRSQWPRASILSDKRRKNIYIYI